MGSMGKSLRLQANRLGLVALFALGCTKATPDPGVTKDPSATATQPPPSDPPPPSAAPATAPPATANAPTVPSGEIDEAFVEDAKTAFAEYKKWGRVDDEMRWAPWLCRMPMPGRPHMSKAEDGGHARKLYSLFAKDHNKYVLLAGSNAKPVDHTGQIIAKESWVPELVSEQASTDPRGNPFERIRGDGGLSDPINADHFNPYLREGEKLYRASTFAGVYFMIRKPTKTPRTDQGWIYATVTPTGEVTSAGRVSSCMGCHASAKHERLFGATKTAY